MARDLDNVYEVLTDGWYLSNSLYALNDPNISSINYQKIILGINAVCKPFNDQVYPKLTL